MKMKISWFYRSAENVPLVLSFFCQALLIAIAWWFVLSNEPINGIYVTLLIFGVYILLGFRDAKNNKNAKSHPDTVYPALLMRYGDTVYFMGYLTTITALVVTAVQIGSNKSMLDDVAMLLGKGGFAITSTVAGLVGMFLFRLATPVQTNDEPDATPERGFGLNTAEELSQFSQQANDILNSLKDKSLEVFSAFDQMSSQLGSAQVKALSELFGKVEGLAGSVNNLTGSVGQTATGLQTLQRTSDGANAALATMAGHTTSIKDSMSLLDDLSSRLVPVWQQISAHLETSSDITHKIRDLGHTLAVLQAGFGACQGQLAQFTKISQDSHQQLLTTLETMQQRASQIGSLAEPIERFADAAQKIAQAAPALNVIMANLHEALPLNDAMGQLLGSVQTLNSTLNAAANATGTISENSRKMMANMEPLVQSITDQIHKLNSNAAALSAFTTKMEAIQPQLDTLAKSGTVMESLGTNLISLQGKLGELEKAVGAAAGKMGHIEGVVASFVSAWDALLAGVNNSRSTTSWPPGRRPS